MPLETLDTLLASAEVGKGDAGVEAAAQASGQASAQDGTGPLEALAGRLTVAIREVVSARACEIWMWRGEAGADSATSLIARSGESIVGVSAGIDQVQWRADPRPDEGGIDGRGSRRVEVPGSGAHERPLGDGWSVCHVPLGAVGFVAIVVQEDRVAEAVAVVTPRAAAIASRLVDSLPSSELQSSHRWLLSRNELDRRAAKALAGVQTLAALGPVIESLADEMFPIEYSGIYFVDPSSNRLRLIYAKGLSESERLAAESTAMQRHPGEVLRTGLPVAIEDTAIERHPHEPPGHGRLVRSRVYLPVWVSGTVVGAIGFASSQPRSFGQLHHRALAFLCELSGLTYARLLAQSETERRVVLIEASATATSRLLAATEWQGAATASLALVGDAIGASTLALIRLEQRGAAKEIDFIWQRMFGEPWPNRERFARLTDAEVGRLSKGHAVEITIGGRLLSTAKPVLVENRLWGVLVCELPPDAAGSIGRAERAGLRALANGFAAAIGRAELEEALRERHKLDAVSRLASGIAHDFNNLLWPVLLYSEILERGSVIEDRERGMLRDIRRSAARASELVQQVFAVSKSRDRVLQVIDVPEIAVEVTATARRAAPAQVVLVATIDADAGHIVGSEEEVRQAMLGLLAESLEAIGDDEGRIRLELSRLERDRGSWIEVLVADDGRRMAEQSMGIRSVRRVVGELGGEFEDSAAGARGSERRIRLPIALREVGVTDVPPIAELEAEAAKTEDLGEPTSDEDCPPSAAVDPVLLVDDDAAVLEVARQILESLGYAVIACSRPEDALERLRARDVPLSLLLTDLAMPGMDGLTLAREAKSLRPELPIVCCTGFGDARSERIAREIGVSAFIRKPIDFDHYAKTIRAAIEGSRRG